MKTYADVDSALEICRDCAHAKKRTDFDILHNGNAAFYFECLREPPEDVYHRHLVAPFETCEHCAPKKEEKKK